MKGLVALPVIGALFVLLNCGGQTDISRSAALIVGSAVKLTIPLRPGWDHGRYSGRYQPVQSDGETMGCSGGVLAADSLPASVRKLLGGGTPVISAGHCVEYASGKPIAVSMFRYDEYLDIVGTINATGHVVLAGKPEENGGDDLVLLSTDLPSDVPAARLLSASAWVGLGTRVYDTNYLWGWNDAYLIDGILGNKNAMFYNQWFYGCNLSIRPGSSGSPVFVVAAGKPAIIEIVTRWDGRGGFALGVPYWRIHYWMEGAV